MARARCFTSLLCAYFSAKMSRAPAKASFTLTMPLASSTELAATASGASHEDLPPTCSINLAKGPRPRSRASCARVCFFDLKGAQRSSISSRTAACNSAARSGSVSASRLCSASATRMRRASKASTRCNPRSTRRNSSSFSEPVSSLRYRAMKGIVLPSSSNFMVAATRRLSSATALATHAALSWAMAERPPKSASAWAEASSGSASSTSPSANSARLPAARGRLDAATESTSWPSAFRFRCGEGTARTTAEPNPKSPEASADAVCTPAAALARALAEAFAAAFATAFTLVAAAFACAAPAFAAALAASLASFC
mmetsp:Transcript_19545/g.50109  ORF Transcript_19545/g.50109 Transcript_19545/m.50109 type:complete len:314 (+) Transcript_19545:1826-2767(+)